LSQQSSVSIAKIQPGCFPLQMTVWSVAAV
jgi:hypothetical protein